MSYDANLVANKMLDDQDVFRDGDNCIVKVKGSVAWVTEHLHANRL